MNLWGPTMFVAVLLMIFTGYPVAFALGGTALIFALIGSVVGVFDIPLLFALPERTFGTMSNFTLLAVPFFIFTYTAFKNRGHIEFFANAAQIFIFAFESE